MLNVVTWLWKPQMHYRSKFGAKHVNILRAMVARHYQQPHEFVCVTDMPTGIDSRVRIVPAWNDYATVPSPHGGHNPSCYRRLRAFAPDIAAVFGERFVSLDLDLVITGDLAPLWDRPEDFIACGETSTKSWYNGSMFALRAGSRPQVWTQFNPKTSPQAAHSAGRFGSDQGWLSHCLGKGEAIWTTKDGVYSYNVHLRHKGRTLPKDARVVNFHGSTDPDAPDAQQLAWVREHYRV